jgi:2-hydroxy-3-keto-5-methylthiopentenyl-1-phosphate phosphatase
LYKNKLLSNYRIFFDFDNTVTLVDVIDDMIKRFSVRDDWIALQKNWQLGEITAIECLTGQMKWIRISGTGLERYLKTIKIDPYFPKLIELLCKEGVKPVILSDNFEPIIKIILENNGIKEVPIYANRLKLYKDRLYPSFPYQNLDCPFCAHCKKIHLQKDIYLDDNEIIYVGDGRSDFCPAMESDIVFAKDSLLKYLIKNKRPCIEYHDLSDVYDHLKESSESINLAFDTAADNRAQ